MSDEPQACFNQPRTAGREAFPADTRKEGERMTRTPQPFIRKPAWWGDRAACSAHSHCRVTQPSSPAARGAPQRGSRPAMNKPVTITVGFCGPAQRRRSDAERQIISARPVPVDLVNTGVQWTDPTFTAALGRHLTASNDPVTAEGPIPHQIVTRTSAGAVP